MRKRKSTPAADSVAKKKCVENTFHEGQQVCFDETKTFIIQAVTKRGLGKGGFTSYTLDTAEGNHIWCPSKWKPGAKIKDLNVVKKDENGKYTFSNEDFEVGDEVRLNKFYPMKIIAVEDEHVIVSRNDVCSSRFAKEYIIPADEDTKKFHNLFWEEKDEFTETKVEWVWGGGGRDKPNHREEEYVVFKNDVYEKFLLDNCADEGLVALYMHLRCGCQCCWT